MSTQQAIDRARLFRERLAAQSSSSAAAPPSVTDFTSSSTPIAFSSSTNTSVPPLKSPSITRSFPPGLSPPEFQRSVQGGLIPPLAPREPVSESPATDLRAYPPQPAQNTPHVGSFAYATTSAPPPPSRQTAQSMALQQLQENFQKQFADIQQQLSGPDPATVEKLRELEVVKSELAANRTRLRALEASVESGKQELGAANRMISSYVETLKVTETVMEAVNSESKEKDLDIGKKIGIIQELEAKIESLNGEMEKMSLEAREREFERLRRRLLLCSRTFSAFDVFKVSRDVEENELVTLYQALMVNKAQSAKLYRGAFHAIASSRMTSDILYPHLRAIVNSEILSYLESVSIPPLRSLADDAVTEAIGKEKTRAAKMETKLNLAHKNLETQKAELQSWRSRAESAEKIAESQPKRAALLLADLATQTDRSKALELKLADLTKKLEREEKEKNRAVERATLVEKKVEQRLADSAVVAAESLRTVQTELDVVKGRLKEAESFAVVAPTSTSVDDGTSTSAVATVTTTRDKSAFVIKRLAERVTSLSDQLSAKETECTELMIRLIQGGDDE